jgi:hypothetical protein
MEEFNPEGGLFDGRRREGINRAVNPHCPFTTPEEGPSSGICGRQKLAKY